MENLKFITAFVGIVWSRLW